MPSDPLMVGMDAEFVLGAPRTREIIRACDMFSFAGNAGVDGAGDAMEIRPFPSANIDEVIDSTREALNLVLTLDADTGKVPWSCGSSVIPVGCHVHFNRNLGEDPGNIALLDSLLAAPMLTVTDGGSASCRFNAGYGTLSDTRNDHRTNEGKSRTEYRSLGCVWGTPSSLKTVLKVAQKISGIEGREDEEEQTNKFGEAIRAIFPSSRHLHDAYAAQNLPSLCTWREKMLKVMSELDYWRDIAEEYATLLTGRILPITDLKELWSVTSLPTKQRKSRIANTATYIERRETGAIEPFAFYEEIPTICTKHRATPKKKSVLFSSVVTSSVEEEED